MELVYIDYLTVQSDKSKKDVSILVVTGHFTSNAETFLSLPSQTASVTAQTF